MLNRTALFAPVPDGSTRVNRSVANPFLNLLAGAVVMTLLICLPAQAHAQTYQWTWIDGSSTLPVNGTTVGSPSGVIGTPGVFAATNLPGGHSDAVTWTDDNGNLWMFGGYGKDTAGNSGYLNDIWEFDPLTQQWTMTGVPIYTCGSTGGCGFFGNYAKVGSAGTPAGRASAAGWTDASGNFWFFGGYGETPGANTAYQGVYGYFNDLWEISPTWVNYPFTTLMDFSPGPVWISGVSTAIQSGGTGGYGIYGVKGSPAPENYPGVRSGAATWTDDDGYFWLLGGQGAGALGDWGTLNDLWRYNPSTNVWTWMGGSSKFTGDFGPTGVYGTKGTAAAENAPGGRENAATWIDINGNLWLFGGYGIDSEGHEGHLNDLWEFNLSTNEWTWIAGGNLVKQPGVYGTLKAASAANTPGGRQFTSSWVDTDGNLWLLGGQGFDSVVKQGYLNDLWVFNLATSQWTWMGGSSTLPAPNSSGNSGEPGVYGTEGEAGAANTPGGRDGSAAWTDNNGHLIFFGGLGFDASGNFGYPNDMWSYQPTPLTATTTTLTSSANPSAYGPYVTLTATVTSSAGAPPDGELVELMYGKTLVSYSWLQSGTATFSVGSYSSGLSGFNAGTYSFTAVYPGDRDFAASTSKALSQVVAKAVTAMVLTAGTNPSSLGGLATFTATFQGFTPGVLPTGNVSFKSGSTVLGSAPIYWTYIGSGNVPVSVFSYPLPLGTSTITAVYPGATDFTSSTSNAVSQVVTAEVTSDWIWMGGSSSDGVYGTLGTAAYGNIPGSRDYPSSWTTSGTNLWLFGGSGYDPAYGYGSLNDLWEYSPATGEWTWKAGSNIVNVSGTYGTLGTAAAANTPGGREGATSWTGVSGQLWLFGGSGTTGGNSGFLNDLWQFSPTTNEWTWTSGSDQVNQPGVYGTLGKAATGNIPGTRQYTASWTDSSGHLWLFGGYGDDSTNTCCDLNDLWEYYTGTKEWTWQGGSNRIAAPGVYGTLGTGAKTNIPGARSEAYSWTDANGNFWLFGGNGYDSAGVYGYLNDLWMFTPSSGEWTWVSGSSTVGAGSGGKPGIYGTVGVAAAANVPGGRVAGVSWTDKAGDLWLYGGYGYDSTGSAPLYLSDLWKYSSATKEWTWMDGSDIGNQAVMDGTLGAPAATNTPGGRANEVGWADSSGHFWLFGGDQETACGIYLCGVTLDDMWEYSLAAAYTAVTPKPAFSVAAGTYVAAQTVAISESLKGATIHYTTDGTVPTASSPAYTAPITVSKTTTLQAIAVATGVGPSAVTKAVYNVNSPSAVSPKPITPAGKP